MSSWFAQTYPSSPDFDTDTVMSSPGSYIQDVDYEMADYTNEITYSSSFTHEFQQIANCEVDSNGWGLVPSERPVIGEVDALFAEVEGFGKFAGGCFTGAGKLGEGREFKAYNMFGEVQEAGRHEWMTKTFNNYMLPAHQVAVGMLDAAGTGYVLQKMLGEVAPAGLEEYVQAYEANNINRLFHINGRTPPNMEAGGHAGPIQHYVAIKRSDTNSPTTSTDSLIIITPPTPILELPLAPTRSKAPASPGMLHPSSARQQTPRVSPRRSSTSASSTINARPVIAPITTITIKNYLAPPIQIEEPVSSNHIQAEAVHTIIPVLPAQPQQQQQQQQQPIIADNDIGMNDQTLPSAVAPNNNPYQLAELDDEHSSRIAPKPRGIPVPVLPDVHGLKTLAEMVAVEKVMDEVEANKGGKYRMTDEEEEKYRLAWYDLRDLIRWTKLVQAEKREDLKEKAKGSGDLAAWRRRQALKNGGAVKAR